ncbi:MAG: hypothetical protein LC104_13215 [Bacteroidales bacterium]|nr:hypothetical protein [Bacteroidales bacterium]
MRRAFPVSWERGDPARHRGRLGFVDCFVPVVRSLCVAVSRRVANRNSLTAEEVRMWSAIGGSPIVLSIVAGAVSMASPVWTPMQSVSRDRDAFRLLPHSHCAGQSSCAGLLYPPADRVIVPVSATRSDKPSDKQPTILEGYRLLLAEFDEKNQGHGLDTFRNVVAAQPMTYGLVLSSEAIRHRQEHDAESGRRVRQAAQWLMDNRDLDQDGKPGWGIPQAWDAFADGTENPPHTAYTITTAIVLEGLLEALALEEFWKPAERQEMRKLVTNVQLRWCQELWVEGFGGGFFRYSVRPSDAVFSVNAPAMYLASMVRLLQQHGSTLAEADRALLERRTHALAKAILRTVERRGGLPYWPYTPLPNKLNRKAANDLVHHAYIVWGVEAYRDFAANVTIPWTRKQALQSFDAFWRDGTLGRFGTDDPDVTAAQLQAAPRLWGTGMALAVCARYGSPAQADAVYRELLRQHGPLPKLRLSSAAKVGSAPFYPRHAAHVLLGLAHAAFGENVQATVPR